METTNTTALIEVLHDLVEINNDRIQGYNKAVDQAKNNPALQTLFQEKASQSQKFITELQTNMSRVNQEKEYDTTLRGKIFRSWMDVKNTFKPNDKTSVLDSCEFGEGAAVRAYESALESDDILNSDVHSKISEQYSAIKSSLVEIKTKRESAEALNK